MRNLKPVLTFFLVCFIGALLVYWTDNSCDAISRYSYNIQFGMSSIFSALLQMIIIFAVGILLFMLFRKKIKQEKYENTKIIFFAFLPLLVFHYQFLLIPNNIMNSSIVKSICNKSSTSGMRTKSKNINLNEFCYLKKQLSLLPSLPKTSENITLSYFGDDFLGDFDLHIDFSCERNEPIDTTDKRWTIINIDELTNKKFIQYQDFRD